MTWPEKWRKSYIVRLVWLRNFFQNEVIVSAVLGEHNRYDSKSWSDQCGWSSYSGCARRSRRLVKLRDIANAHHFLLEILLSLLFLLPGINDSNSEQLDKIEENLGKVNNDLKVVSHNITDMEHYCGCNIFRILWLVNTSRPSTRSYKLFSVLLSNIFENANVTSLNKRS